MAVEPWRLSRTELRELLTKYDRAVENDAFSMVQPNAAERKVIPPEIFQRRAEAVKRARDTNRRFIEAVVEDLPDFCTEFDAQQISRPIATLSSFYDPTIPTLPASSYGSVASVFLHLLRDWNAEQCEHVHGSTYGPVIAELRALLPNGGDVLVPGAGLGRLALTLAREGYRVEANEASRLFLTFADYMLNRAPADGHCIFPMAHVFSENWSHQQQYMQVTVPTPQPAEVARDNGSSVGITLAPGNFAKLYGTGCPGHRRFDALVTCFFIDTPSDVIELFNVMDGLLAEGGVWVNIGPLNWQKDCRQKFTWEEIVTIWESFGYEFVTQKRSATDYHLARGLKMYTESYNCSLSAAVKRGTRKEAMSDL